MSKQNTLSLAKISWPQWLLLLCYVLLSFVMIWQFILPYLAERHYRDGYNFGAQGRLPYAIHDLEKAIAYAPWETQYLVQLGKYYEDSIEQSPSMEDKVSFLRKAEAIYTRSIELDPLNPWYHNRMASVYMMYAQLYPQKNAEYLSKAQSEVVFSAKLDSQNPLFRLNYASFLHRYNQIEAALAEYKTVIEMDPDMPEPYFNMADIYRRKGDTKKMLELYMTVYKLNPKFSNVALAIAGTYVQLQDSDRAIHFLEESLSDNPKHKEALKSIASLYYQKGQFDKSVSALRMLMSFFPDSKMEVFGFYIQVLMNAKQRDQAIYDLKTYLQEFPNDIRAKNTLKSLGG